MGLPAGSLSYQRLGREGRLKRVKRLTRVILVGLEGRLGGEPRV